MQSSTHLVHYTGEKITKRISILNAAGETLVGVLDDTGAREVVILSHGFRSSKEDAVLLNVASALTRIGMSTFRFDFSGNGESGGHFQYGNYWKEVEDLRAVIVYWTRNGRVVNAIVGHSKGGNAAVLYASKYRDVSTIVNLSGRYSLEQGMKERLGENFLEKIKKDGFLDVIDKQGNVEYRVNEESLRDRLNTHMQLAISEIPKECRVLTLHGSKDQVVAFSQAFEFDKHIANHTLKIIDGADHVYSKHKEELSALVLEFLKGDAQTCRTLENKMSKELNRTISRI